MSVITCVCSDRPLQEYPEHVPSSAEELQQLDLPEGIGFIPAQTVSLETSIWRDSVPLDDDDLVIFHVDVRKLEIITAKKYCAIVQWDFNAQRGERLIRYLRAHMKNASEIELWHFWADGDFSHRSLTIDLPFSQLTSNRLEQIESIPVWEKPLLNYCYRISLP